MAKNRESNFDLLRILSAFAVVMLHVSGGFLQIDEMKVSTNCHFPIMLINHLVRFAVPCFFMLSGAFVLADERNANYKYFYKKSFRNIGISSVIFCMLYVIFGVAKLLAGVFIFKRHGIDHVLLGLISAFKNIVTGNPYYHLWYLFTLLGLYLAVPFVIRLAADLRGGGVNLYGNISVVFLALASVSYITSEQILKWDIGWQFCFLSYFLMGYKLRKWGMERKNNRTAFLLILAGFAVNAGLAYVNYLRGLKGLPVDASYYADNPVSYGPLAPIEVIASCLVFAGFSVLDIKKDFSKLAGYTFLIYLIHAGVWDVISTVVGDRLIGNQNVEFISVFIFSIIVFFASFLIALAYKKVFKIHSK